MREKPLQSEFLNLHCVSSTFLESQILQEISSIVEDILEPYVFEKIGMDNVYSFEEKAFKISSLSIKDILINAFLGKRQNISRIRLKNSLAEVVLLVLKTPEKDGKFDFGDFGRIEPEKVIIFEEIFSHSKLHLLKQCFSMLWNIYQRIERQDKLDQKFIFKMYGFHALFTEPKNAEESYICKENKKLLSENVQSIIQGNGGIIDAQDNIGLFGGGSKNDFLVQIDLIYSEIARLLKVPLTRLLGRSPQGFNATGESDRLDYDLTLDRYRSGWLEPFFQQMDIQYEKVSKIDVEYLQKVLEMHTLFEIELEQNLKEKIKNLAQNL